VEIRPLLSHAYGPLRVLDDISFSAEDGQFVALVGTNSCGKTAFRVDAPGRQLVWLPDYSRLLLMAVDDAALGKE